MKHKAIKGAEAPVLVGIVRKRKCQIGYDGECENKTKLVLIVPCSDIEDDGGPGLAAVPVCGEHIERAIIAINAQDNAIAQR